MGMCGHSETPFSWTQLSQPFVAPPLTKTPVTEQTLSLFFFFTYGRCAVTYVTRTLAGEPGTTYKYLGLR